METERTSQMPRSEKEGSVFFTPNVSWSPPSWTVWTSQLIFDLDAAHSHSTYNLSEAEEKKKQKRKSNRISRVIEEFINMGDVISNADKRISK